MPPELFRLRDLKILKVEDCHLKTVPPEIGALRKLRDLSFRDNELTSVPPEIGELVNLRSIDLGFNKLTSLPVTFRKLKNLQQANLFDNKFTEFPLDWSGDPAYFAILIGLNQIREIPAGIARLSNLRYLEIGMNQLTELPPELGEFPDDIRLYLTQNPLRDPFPQLVERGVPDLLAYLRSIKAEGVRQYEAKLVLVGEGNVGKTSLVAALNSQPFVSDRSTTHGIEVTQLKLPHPSLSCLISLNTWDFGGQEVYRITHQFFFSRRCLYMLVWRPREGQEENAIEEWCRRIRLRVGEDARILIVATHADERRAELDYPYLKRQFGDTLVGHYQVDNLSGRGVAELREKVASLAAELPQMGEKISPSWIDIRNEVDAITEPQISFGKFAELSARRAVDSSQQSALIGLLHDVGQIIHFGEDDGLRDVIVLQPEWLTKAIGYILEDQETESSLGILDHRRLANIWQDNARDTQYRREYHPYFLRMMEKFDVSYRIADEDKSLVAQLVPYAQPDLPWHPDEPLRPGTRQLVLLFKLSDSAPGLIAWLTVRNHRFAAGRHWRRGVFLNYGEHQAEALLIQHASRELMLVVRAPSPDYFFSILRDSVESLVERRWPGLEYEMLIPCPYIYESGTQCSGQFEFRALETYRERGIPTVRCSRCIEEQNVTELLTGFALSDAPLARLMEAVNHRADEIQEDLLLRAEEIKAHQSQTVAMQSAEIAGQLRALMLAVGREMPDCPRLFTLVSQQPRGLNRIQAWRHGFLLTLWCEHSGAEHPCTAARYEFYRPKQWLVTIAPYVLVLTAVLRAALPVAGAALDLALSEKDYKDIKKDLELMKALVDDVSAEPMKIGVQLSEQAGYAPAEGAELRALRTLLTELDPPMRFGGLRRVLVASGEYLWVCHQHYKIYDPGLPVLP